MTEITIIKVQPDSFGEPNEVARYSVPATIDKVQRETVTEDRNERRGYDLAAFVKPADVPDGLDLMTEAFQIELDGKTYAPAMIDAQRDFGGKTQHFNLKARLA